MKKILTGGTVNSLYEKSLLLQLPVPGQHAQAIYYQSPVQPADYVVRFVGRVAVLHMDGIDMVAEPSCGIRTIILFIEPSQSGERIRQVPDTPMRLRYGCR
jgi:hypothetical protein